MFFCAIYNPALCQDAPPSPPADSAALVAPTPAWPDDSLGRRTPRGTVSGFIDAVAKQNYILAGRYLRIDTTLQTNRSRAELARGLQQLLDQRGNIMAYNLLSKDPEGHLNDDLGPNLERIGSARLNSETFALMLERTTDSIRGPIWLFSSQTVQRIPLATEGELKINLVDKISPKVLSDPKWAGVPVSHWLAMLLIIVAAYLLSGLLVNLILRTIPLFWKKARTEPTEGVIKAFGLPVRLYLAIWVFVAISEQIGISIIVRQQFSVVTFIVGIAAFSLLLWRLFNTSTLFIERRLTSRNNMAGVSAVLFMRRIAKFAVFVIGLLFILDSFGFDVTAGIAALGIGGLALALGAQKTVENFVGSVTLIADQPVRVGDFCKVGETSGTVEQIGMRSTRIRTMDRTVVTIPNGDFSSQRIENFAHREKFKLQTIIGLRYETSPDQLRYLLVQIRSLLYAHSKVDPTPARVRFTEFAASSLNLEVFTYIKAKDFNDFTEIREDIFLRIMDIVNASGSGFAIPSQTLYLAKDRGLNKDKTIEAEEKVREWRETNQMQIPEFAPEHINELKETIKYPPEGSAVQQPDQPTLF